MPSPKQQLLPPNPRRRPCLIDVPRPVIIQILQKLELPCLLRTSRVRRQFQKLICNAPELAEHMFRKPPSPDEPALPEYIHPVIEKMHFYAYNPATAIRLGDAGPFLSMKRVRLNYVTQPAVPELGVRIVASGAWEYDEEVCVENPKGVTVWDLAEQVTEFLNSDSDPAMSFQDRFGIEICEKRGYAPGVVMMNFEFLDPAAPFPRIVFLNRDDRLQIIADYTFCNFALQSLIFCPPNSDPDPDSNSSVQPSIVSSRTASPTRPVSTIASASLLASVSAPSTATRTRHRTEIGKKRAAGEESESESEVWVSIQDNKDPVSDRITYDVLPQHRLPVERPEGKRWGEWIGTGERERKEQWIQAIEKQKAGKGIMKPPEEPPGESAEELPDLVVFKKRVWQADG